MDKHDEYDGVVITLYFSVDQDDGLVYRAYLGKLPCGCVIVVGRAMKL